MTTEPATISIERQTISAVVTRADGTVEDLGVIYDFNRDDPKNQPEPSGVGAFLKRCLDAVTHPKRRP